MCQNNDCDAVFESIKAIHEEERELRRQRETWMINPYTRALVTVIIIFAFIALLVLAFASTPGLHSERNIISNGVITCLILIYGGVLYFPLAEFWLRKGDFLDAIREPERITLYNPTITARADLSVTDQLMAINLHTLEMAAMQIQHEVHAFHRRMGVVIGTLEKVGILPALLTLFFITYKLGGFKVGWSSIITSSLPILYLGGMFIHHKLLDLERSHRLLELVIARKREPQRRHRPWSTP